MADHQTRFHLNNPGNVLEKLSAQIDAEYQAALDTPTTNLSRTEQEQLFGRTLALGEARTWLLSARSDDLKEQTEAMRLSNQVRENCRRLSKVYEEFSTFLSKILPQMSKEKAEGFDMMHGVMLQTWPLLRFIGDAMTPEDFAVADRMLNQTESIYAVAKEDFLSAPLNKNQVQ